MIRAVILSLILTVGMLTGGARAETAAPGIGTPVSNLLSPAAKAKAAKAGDATELAWSDLIPEDERANYSPEPPPPLHDYILGESSPAAAQPKNFDVNAKLNGITVKIPGFIVPLEYDGRRRITEFLLVPYFGACIHVPPPPPNQMVYVVAKLKEGVDPDTLYSAFWVVGKMSVNAASTDLGDVAYTMTASAVTAFSN